MSQKSEELQSKSLFGSLAELSRRAHEGRAADALAQLAWCRAHADELCYGEQPLLDVFLPALDEIEAHLKAGRFEAAADKAVEIAPLLGRLLLPDLALHLRQLAAKFREEERFFPLPDGRFRQSDCCPFCNEPVYEDCPHLLTDLLCDWQEFSPEGVCRGAFEKLGGSFGRLNRAIDACLCVHGKKRLRALEVPPRLRALLRSVAWRAKVSRERIWGDFESAEELLAYAAGREVIRETVEHDFAIDTRAYARYIVQACEEIGVGVEVAQFDTNDLYGTCPLVFWTENAAAAAPRLLAVVSAYSERLEAEAGRRPRTKGLVRIAIYETEEAPRCEIYLDETLLITTSHVDLGRELLLAAGEGELGEAILILYQLLGRQGNVQVVPSELVLALVKLLAYGKARFLREGPPARRPRQPRRERPPRHDWVVGRRFRGELQFHTGVSRGPIPHWLPRLGAAKGFATREEAEAFAQKLGDETAEPVKRLYKLDSGVYASVEGSGQWTRLAGL